MSDDGEERRAFADALMAAVAQLDPTRRLQYDPQEFALHDVGAPQNRNYLGNIYAEYRTAPDEARPQVLQRYALSLMPQEFAKEFSEARKHLLPMVRSRDYFTGMQLQFAIEDEKVGPWTLDAVSDHVVATVAYDWPHTLAALDDKTIADWGVTHERAMEAALENLSRISATGFDEESPGLFVSRYRDNHDAARMLLTGTLKRLPLKGEVVAAVPNRDRLIVAGSADEAALGKMAELVRVEIDSPRFISGVAHLLHNGRWEIFTPPPGHPHHNAFRLLDLITRARFYASQKSLLEKLHQKQKKDVFVATYSLTQTKTGEVRSHCVWTRDVPTYLPRTDYVFFVDPEVEKDRGVLGWALWADVEAVVPHLISLVPDGFPPRWRVHGFPTADELARLRIGSAA